MADIVFRVEHPDTSVGPYTHDWITDNKIEAMCRAHMGSKGYRRPWDIRTPKDENLFQINDSSDFVCGFHKLSLLLEWFPRVTRRLMDREGFLLYKFESEEVHKANQQCIFRRSSARELKTYRLVR